MAQRINISISEELFEQLQKVKESINISKICQIAIGEAVKQEGLNRLEDNEVLIARLRKEKEMAYKPFEDEGFKDGIKDAHKWSLKEFASAEIYIKDENNFFTTFEYHSSIGSKKVFSLRDGKTKCVFVDTSNISKEEMAKLIDRYNAGEIVLFDITSSTYPEDFYLANGFNDKAFESYVAGWNKGVMHVWRQVKNKI